MKNNFNEEEVLNWLDNYIRSTYDSPYSQDKIETTEVVFEAGHGIGFCIGNIIKYAQRYGKKKGYNQDDLLKVVHYAIILLGAEHYDKD